MTSTSPQRVFVSASPRSMRGWGVVWVVLFLVSFHQVTFAQPAPKNLTVSNIGRTSVTLSWDGVNQADSYNVQVVSGTDTTSLNTTSTSLQISDLTPGKTYSWGVQTVVGDRTSAFEDGPGFTTESDSPPPPSGPPPTPEGLSSTNVTATGATLQWNASTGAKSYDLQVTGPGSPSYPSNTTGTSVSVTGLTGGSTYNWQVVAKNDSGGSAPASASFTTLVSKPSVAPSIISPSDGDANVPIEPTLAWGPVAGAKTYTVELSDKPSLNPVIFSSSGLTGTSTGVAGLKGETTYYWRVRADNDAGEGPWSSTVNFKTISTRPTAPVLVSPSDRAASVSINTTLLWGNVPNATEYEVSVAEDKNFSSVVGGGVTNRTQFDLSGLAYDKTYYWRVRSTTVGGVSEWSAVWEFKTETGRPAAPSLISPSNNARNVPLDVTLEWAGVTGALSYGVQVATDNNFNQIVAEAESLTTRSYAVNGLSGNTSYRWRVRGHGPNGAGDWSGSWSFETASALPTAPALSLPVDKATNVPFTITLSWIGVGGAQSYNLQLSTDRTFKTVDVEQTGLTGTTFEATGLTASTIYYWRISATNSAGTGPWSGDWSFTTGTGLPAAPEMVSPSNEAKGVSINPLFSWQPLQGVLSYSIQIASDRQFRTLATEQSGLTSPSFSYTGLNPSSTYYWRLSAVNTLGQGPWSDEWSFETGTGALGAPVLISPSDKAQGVSTNPILMWVTSPGAQSYAVQYSTDRNFRKDVVEISGIVTSMTSLEELTPEETYFWRVMARDSSRQSEWSVEFSFETGTGKLGAPSPIAPADGATGVSLVPTLSWSEMPGASTYGVQVASDRNFRTLIAEVLNLERPSFQPPILASNSSYYWRVNASDSAGTSPWSGEWAFVTGSSQLAAPQLVAPSNDAKGVSISPMLIWNAVTGAQRYQVQVAEDQNFKTIVVELTDIRELSAKIPALGAKETYYWRVSAADTVTGSDWSAEWSFTTGSGLLAAPVIISPSDGAAGISTYPTLVWAQVAGASSYQVQLSSDRQFRTIVLEMTDVRETSVGLSSLTPKTDYYWRVRGADSTGGLSDWSVEWSFATGSGRLASPVLLSPSDGATGISTVPIISWSPTPGAMTYALQIAKDQNFNKAMVEVTGLTRSSFTPNELAPEETYYWRVQARDTTSESDWSAAWSFKTGTGKLSTPALVTPPDGGEAPLNATLTWNPSAGATSYAIQVGTDRNFRTLIVDNNNLQATSLTVTGLTERERYYWRVRANSAQEQSDWSGEWVFTASSTATSVEPVETGQPGEFVVHQNYPNPFNPSTTIRFSVPKESSVRIVVYTLLGSSVQTLVDERLHPGTYQTTWNAASMPSGVYFYRLEAGEFVATKRLVLLK